MGYVLALWGEFVKFTGGRAGLVHLLLFAAALVCCFFLGRRSGTDCSGRRCWWEFSFSTQCSTNMWEPAS